MLVHCLGGVGNWVQEDLPWAPQGGTALQNGTTTLTVSVEANAKFGVTLGLYIGLFAEVIQPPPPPSPPPATPPDLGLMGRVNDFFSWDPPEFLTHQDKTAGLFEVYVRVSPRFEAEANFKFQKTFGATSTLDPLDTFCSSSLFGCHGPCTQAHDTQLVSSIKMDLTAAYKVYAAAEWDLLWGLQQGSFSLGREHEIDFSAWNVTLPSWTYGLSALCHHVFSPGSTPPSSPAGVGGGGPFPASAAAPPTSPQASQPPQPRASTPSLPPSVVVTATFLTANETAGHICEKLTSIAQLIAQAAIVPVSRVLVGAEATHDRITTRIAFDDQPAAAAAAASLKGSSSSLAIDPIFASPEALQNALYPANVRVIAIEVAPIAEVAFPLPPPLPQESSVLTPPSVTSSLPPAYPPPPLPLADVISAVAAGTNELRVMLRGVRDVQGLVTCAEDVSCSTRVASSVSTVESHLTSLLGHLERMPSVAGVVERSSTLAAEGADAVEQLQTLFSIVWGWGKAVASGEYSADLGGLQDMMADG